jgi:3-hydroxy-9,10-secoandrosta-1,3,5(10)-triene-9,17-dione monooxygenase reductase component
VSVDERGEIDPAVFRQVLGHVPTGVTVITATTPDGPVGLAIGAFFSVSLDPPLVGFCATRTSVSWAAVRAAGSFSVNVLAEDQEAISRRFAVTGADKFAGVAWTHGPNGAPRLGGVLAWIDCEVHEVHGAGDHELCVGLVHGMEVAHEGGPLIFYRGGYGRFLP